MSRATHLLSAVPCCVFVATLKPEIEQDVAWDAIVVSGVSWLGIGPANSGECPAIQAGRKKGGKRSIL